MSNDNEDYLDDSEILDFNENLDARAAQVQEEHDPSEAFGLEMFGPTGRGASPAMGRQSPRDLSRNADKSLRSVGLDESHLKDTKTWDTKVNEPQPQPQPQPKSKSKLKPTPKVVKVAKARPPQQYRNQYSDNDEKAEEESDKLWRMLGHDPLRYHLPGGQFIYKLPDGRWAPIPQGQKGGTRKRARRTIRRNSRSTRRRSNRKSRKGKSRRR